jgi:putative ABC transport system permease protein
MTALVNDIRQAGRVLRRQPGFAVSAVATIALAIAANTLMFAIVRGVLLNPLPLPEPDRLVRIEQMRRTGPSNVTGATFVDLRAATKTLATVAAFRIAPVSLSVRDAAEQAVATTVTADYFTALGVAPVAGRLPTPDDFQAGGAPVVFLSGRTWERFFNADPAAIGQSMLINAVPRTIAGVVDISPSIPGAADVWVPYSSDSPLFRNRRAHLFTVIGRLRPHVSVAAASSELEAIAVQISRAAPAGDNLSLRAASLRERLVQPVRTTLLVLWAAVGVLLLIAFANVANLLLMQGSMRRRDLSVRTALGASRAALVRQLAVEGGVLGLTGGAAGAAFAAWGVHAFRSFLPASLPRVAEIQVDPVVITFGVSVATLAAVACSLVPAFRASGGGATAALRSREATGGTSRLTDTFVAAQVALTLVLVFGAAILGRSLLAVTRVPLGFDPAGVVAADLSLPTARYDGAQAHARFFDTLLEQVSGRLNVASAGVTGALPLSPTAATTMIAQDARDDSQPIADVITATSGVFAALRIPLLRGRMMTDADRAGAVPVALINEAAARQFWLPGIDPIGRTVEMRDWGPPYRATVIGIVGDVRQAGPDAAGRPAVYYPLEQFPQTTLTQTLVVRTREPLSRVDEEIRRAVRSIDPSQPLARVATMSERIAVVLSPRHFNLMVLGAFAIAALLLASVGIYGLVAFAVATRTREIGVRVALGATPRRIAAFAMSSGAMPIAGGLLLGLAGAVLASRALEALVFGVSRLDTISLAAAALLNGSVALAAVAGPARRAMRVDPIVALRAD